MGKSAIEYCDEVAEPVFVGVREDLSQRLRDAEEEPNPPAPFPEGKGEQDPHPQPLSHEGRGEHVEDGNPPSREASADKEGKSGRWGWHCEKVSSGCASCWAEELNRKSRAGIGTGLDYSEANRDRVKVHLDNAMLASWPRRKKPVVIFVGSKGDLFGEWVLMARVWSVLDAALASPNLHLLFLTKRAERMVNTVLLWMRARQMNRVPGNMWFGVSIENGDPDVVLRLRHLRQLIGKAQAWVSFEPLVGDVGDECLAMLEGIDQAIVGGESGRGPKIRPMPMTAAARIVARCEELGLSLFFKQWGEWVAVPSESVGMETDLSTGRITLDGVTMRRVGKRSAGRVFGGRLYDELVWRIRR